MFLNIRKTMRCRKYRVILQTLSRSIIKNHGILWESRILRIEWLNSPCVLTDLLGWGFTQPVLSSKGLLQAGFGLVTGFSPCFGYSFAEQRNVEALKLTIRIL